MKAVIALSGLAGLIIFGPPFFLKVREHRHEVSVTIHEATHSPEHSRVHEALPIQASWDGQDRCRYEAERSFSVPAGSLRELDLLAGSGSLEVLGVEGLGEIRAVGRACASHEEFLGDLQLTSETQGSALAVEALYPDMSGWRGGDQYARLDLRIEVPVGLAAKIRDGSGEVTVSDLGSLSIQDGSGELVASGIQGDLAIQDGSGEMEIRGVSGYVKLVDGSGEIVLEDVGLDVEIRDSSGGLEIRGVGGSLVLTDGSGEVAVEDVAGTVRVIQDSSGDIEVNGVGGDFVVERDGSGEIRYENVGGTVDIPRKKRER